MQTTHDSPGYARQRWLVLLLIVVLGLVSNACRDLVQPDEGRYAEIPREMLASGDYVVPHLNGLPYVEKPPLQYWMTAAAYRVFGVADWVSRLWNLLLGMVGVVIVYATGRRLWTPRAGEFAALVLLSVPLYTLVGQLNLLDMGLSVFLTAALCAFLLAQRDAATPADNRRWMSVCWVAIGLGFLQKGLVAFAVPFLALVTYSLVQRDVGLWRRLQLGSGVLIVGLLSLPWLVLLALRDGDYAWFFLVHEHFTRFMTTEHQRSEPWWFFLAIFAAGALPWCLPMLQQAWQRIGSRRRDGFDPAAALALWAIVVVVFFSLSGSKLAPYIMPALPPLALLVGQALDARPATWMRGFALVAAGLLALALLSAPLWADALVSEGLRKPYYLAVSRWAMVGGAAALCGVLLAAWCWRRGQLRAGVISLCLGLYGAWMGFLGGSNLMATVRGAPGAGARMAPAIAAGAPFYCVGAYLQSLTFEVGQACRLVEYTGELQLQFDRDGRQAPLSFDAFVAAWQSGGKAYALFNRRDLPRLAASGIETKPVAEYPEFVIVEHP